MVPHPRGSAGCSPPSAPAGAGSDSAPRRGCAEARPPRAPLLPGGRARGGPGEGWPRGGARAVPAAPGAVRRRRRRRPMALPAEAARLDGGWQEVSEPSRHRDPRGAAAAGTGPSPPCTTLRTSCACPAPEGWDRHLPVQGSGHSPPACPWESHADLTPALLPRSTRLCSGSSSPWRCSGTARCYTRDGVTVATTPSYRK